jgi:hypothetical protein
MGKSSRQKRRTYQTPARARRGANTVWYAAAAILVIAGSLGVAFSRSNTANGIGPTATDHWHAALGVDDCGKWVPNWSTPFAADGRPVRAGTSIYAGMHSHGDGLMHMEPQSSIDMGKNATVGNYFKSAGFKLDSTSISFPSVDEKNGNKCNGKQGVLRWAVNGKEKHGNPAKYKLFDGDVVEIVFTTADAKLPKKTEVPSYAKLQEVLGNPENPAAPDTGATTTAPNASTSSTPTTVGITTTSKP